MPGRSSSSSSSSSAYTSPAQEAHLLARWFTAARRQGLLAQLSPEVWQTLSAVLSFTCRDGARRFTLDQLALTLALPRDKAEERLAQLAQVSWHNQSLATIEHDHDSTVVGATLAPIELLSRVQPAVALSGAASGDVQSNSAPPELVEALLKVGLDEEQVEYLTRSFPEERLRRQLSWLPKREARNPAAMLLRAIEQNWSAPKGAG